MINEQIKQASEEYANKEWPFEGYCASSDSFSAGILWYINSIWHGTENTPKENSKIILIDKFGEWYNISYSFDEYDDALGKGWESCVRTYNIDKWAYLDDLLPDGKEDDKWHGKNL